MGDDDDDDDDDDGGGTLVATPRIWRERAKQAREAKNQEDAPVSK